MLYTALMTAFEIDKGFCNLKFVGKKLDELLVGLPFCGWGVKGDDKSMVVEFLNDLGFFGIRFNVNDEDHGLCDPEVTRGLGNGMWIDVLWSTA